MKYVFIDTNIYLYCSLGSYGEHEPTLLKAIADVVNHSDACLLVPETVRREYEHQMKTKVDDYDRQAQEALAEAKKKLPAPPDRERVTAVIDDIRRERRESAAKAQEYFADLMKDGKTVGLPLDGDTVARALGYSISGQAPSKGKTARDRADASEKEPGFVVEPDCLIVASVARYLQAQGAGDQDELYICTHNREDFAEFDQDADAHVVAAAIAAEIPCVAKYHSSLPGLLEAEFAEVELTDDQKARYDSAKEEAQALSAQERPRAIGPIETIDCPRCGLPVSAVLPATPNSTVEVTCEDCGRQFGLLRHGDGACVVLSKPREERQLDIVCPECGSEQRARTFTDRDGPLERWCLRCDPERRLTVDPLTGDVTRTQVDPAVPAESVGESEDRRMLLQCPQCKRITASFWHTPQGIHYAICTNERHGSMLLKVDAKSSEG